MARCMCNGGLLPSALKTFTFISNSFLQSSACGNQHVIRRSASFILCNRKLKQIRNQFRSVSHQLDTSSKNSVATVSFLNTFWNKITFKSGKRLSKSTIKISALRLYLCCIELVSHDTFIREFGLSDTFNSWFRVLELHLWMLVVRLSDEGKDGLALRNSIISFMWQDIDKKTKKLGELATMTARKEGMLDISEQFKAALFSYDEGLLGDDKQLAGALWRNFFDKNCNNAHNLERMVEYVRKQMHHLDRYSSEELLNTGIIEFLPLIDSAEMRSRNKLILVQIFKRI